MFKLIHFTDLHLCPLNHIPASRTATYHEDTAEEIRNLFSCIKEEDPQACVFTGDLFHLKNQAAYSPKDLNYYHTLFSQYPRNFTRDLCCIPGNHDLPKSSLDLLGDSPYTTLTVPLNEIFKDLSFRYREWDLGDGWTFLLFGIPYVQVDRLQGEIKDQFRDFCKNKLEALQRVLGVDPKKIITGLMLHVDAFPDASAVKFWKTLAFDEVCGMFPGIDLFFFGHIHYSFDPYVCDKWGKRQIICKPWSMARVIKDYFNQENDLIKHQPSYALVTIETVGDAWGVKIEYKEVPHKPFDQVFQKDSFSKQIQKSQEISGFIQSLKDGSNGNIKELFCKLKPEEILGAMTIEQEVMNIIQEYMQR